MSIFAPIIGQQTAIELLTQAVKRDRVPPAYLFAGSAGIGRRLVAKCFIELLFSDGVSPDKHTRIRQQLQKGNHPDLLWVEPTYSHAGKLLTAQEAAETGLKRKAPPQIRIEQIRDISEFLSRPPLEARQMVVVLEDAQTMAEGAANALLKTLEEPGRATIILIAPNADSLLPTLVSRCQRIPFYPLANEEMKQVLQQNGYTEILEDEILVAIAQGSPGAAISAWQQRQTIPETLLQQLTSPPPSPVSALQLAKEINKNLDTETQLWLIEYLQYKYWREIPQSEILKKLENTRQALLRYVQPRLAWECLLLGIYRLSQEKNLEFVDNK